MPMLGEMPVGDSNKRPCDGGERGSKGKSHHVDAADVDSGQVQLLRSPLQWQGSLCRG